MVSMRVEVSGLDRPRKLCIETKELTELKIWNGKVELRYSGSRRYVKRYQKSSLLEGMRSPVEGVIHSAGVIRDGRSRGGAAGKVVSDV